MVVDAYTYSNHLAVCYSIDYNNIRHWTEERTTRIWPSPRMWKKSYFNDKVFRKALHSERNILGLSDDRLVTALRWLRVDLCSG